MSGGSVADPDVRESAARVRELEAAHEIAQAFLAATQPMEVYRLALARLTPMVRADFAAVFLRDEAEAGVLKPVAAQGWPQSSARYLGQLRIRVGAGPTGSAVAEGRPLEVEDIFGDEALTAWWEPARELGFASMITLPLTVGGGPKADPAGALSFYFAEPRSFTDEERRLLGLIARQLGATSRRAQVVAELRADAERLRREGEALSGRVHDLESRAVAHDQLLMGAVSELWGTLGEAHRDATAWGATVPSATTAAIGAALATAGDLLDFLAVRLSYWEPTSRAEDAARLARAAVQAAGAAPPHVPVTIEAGDTLLPVTTDGPAVIRVLATLLRQAFRRTVRGAVDLDVRNVADERGPAVEWLVRVRGLGLETGLHGESVSQPGRGAESLTLALAGQYAAALGGSLTSETESGVATLFRLRLPARQPTTD